MMDPREVPYSPPLLSGLKWGEKAVIATRHIFDSQQRLGSIAVPRSGGRVQKQYKLESAFIHFGSGNLENVSPYIS